MLLIPTRVLAIAFALFTMVASIPVSPTDPLEVNPDEPGLVQIRSQKKSKATANNLIVWITFSHGRSGTSNTAMEYRAEDVVKGGMAASESTDAYASRQDRTLRFRNAYTGNLQAGQPIQFKAEDEWLAGYCYPFCLGSVAFRGQGQFYGRLGHEAMSIQRFSCQLRESAIYPPLLSLLHNIRVSKGSKPVQ
ncbi:hypothetical protein F5050DRAFT_1020905 [Lentinula boryana]|uniref:Uncharacterized protein n=1 Tax=Lentinula boryana TaxID=40481 RepID=A0ABQ8Q0V5_9AGAR|nr:hypothetical protein F5050DRAFT_1020905 [Lentinula boryana]